MQYTRVFLDTEFTGLTQRSSLISLGLVTEAGHSFYAEFTDFDRQQLEPWQVEHVLPYCNWLHKPGYTHPPQFERQGKQWQGVGPTSYLQPHLVEWLGQFSTVQVWADCAAYDWVLFCELFGGSQKLPAGVSYMVQDLATLFVACGHPPDINRQQFSRHQVQMHHALEDARLCMACYQQLALQLFME